MTHILELLGNGNPELHGISRVYIWARAEAFAVIADRPWLVKIAPNSAALGLLRRSLWQGTKLSAVARSVGCDLLFVPGGSFAGDFEPVVSMSQNMLPFEWEELGRYGLSLKSLRLLALRWSQSRTFRRSDGVIFLTYYAKDHVLANTRAVRGQTRIISHGLSARFQCPPKVQHPITQYDEANPYRVLYVSIIDEYKHQWNVVEAIASLRAAGMPIALELIGPAYAPALSRLTRSMDRFDPKRNWVTYSGEVPFDQLHLRYTQANLGVFASSCENQPIILLETMAAGLPIACSNFGPMPEVLGGEGIYFNPERPADIARAVRELVESPALRAEAAAASYARSQEFTWQRCANETLAFLARIATQHKASKCAAS